MDAFDGAAGGVVLPTEGGVPLEGDRGRAGNAGLLVHTARGGVAGEMLGKDAAVEILLLVERRIDGETLRGMRHLLVADGLGSHRLQGVNPRIAHPVAELLLLPPGHRLGQQVGKGLADNLLLNDLAGTHLGLGIQAHRHIEERLVEERHTPLDAPGGQALVGTEAVVEVQFGELAHRLLVEGPGIGRLVKIEVAAEDLVGALAREHHLDAHRTDDAGQEIHRRGGAHGGDVVGLDEIDHIAQGVKALLHRVVDLMVYGADMLRHHAGLGQIGRTLQADGKGMQAGPPGAALRVVLDAVLREALGNGGDDR